LAAKATKAIKVTANRIRPNGWWRRKTEDGTKLLARLIDLLIQLTWDELSARYCALRGLPRSIRSFLLRRRTIHRRVTTMEPHAKLSVIAASPIKPL
jgi:hypothetical protein